MSSQGIHTMPSAAQWNTLKNKIDYTAQLIDSMLSDTDLDESSLQDREVLQDAMQDLRESQEACGNWLHAQSGSSLDRGFQHTQGSTNAYETAQENLKSARETITLNLLVEQRKFAKSRAHEIAHLQDRIKVLETTESGTNYNVSGHRNTVVIVKHNNVMTLGNRPSTAGSHVVRGFDLDTVDPLDSVDPVFEESVRDMERESMVAEQEGQPAPVTSTSTGSKPPVITPLDKHGVYSKQTATAESQGTLSAGDGHQSFMTVTEYAAWFQDRTGASQDAVPISVILDTDSERDLISRSFRLDGRIWSLDQEVQVKQIPFPGSRGKMSEADAIILLTWRPEGSAKWMDTDFYIVDEDEPIVILGKEWADFRGIFHDMDVSVAISTLRFPWQPRLTSAEKEERRKKQDEINQKNRELHRRAIEQDRRNRQSPPLEIPSPQDLSTPVPRAGSSDDRVASSGTVTPSSSAPKVDLTDPTTSSGIATPEDSGPSAPPIVLHLPRTNTKSTTTRRRGSM